MSSTNIVIKNADNNIFGAHVPMLKRDFTVIVNEEVLPCFGTAVHKIHRHTHLSIAAALTINLNVVVLPNLTNNRRRHRFGPHNAPGNRCAVPPTDTHYALGANSFICWQHVLEN